MGDFFAKIVGCGLAGLAVGGVVWLLIWLFGGGHWVWGLSVCGSVLVLMAVTDTT